ncbi:MAG: hypothetical protein ABIO44_08775, partial [Saprospiraceae bacterium]
MKKLFLCFLIATSFQLHSQDIIIQGKSLPLNPEYSVKFNSYELYEIDVEEVRNKIVNSPRSGIDINLVLGHNSHLLQVNKFNVIKPNCKVRIATANGIIEVDPDPTIQTYRGYNANFGGREVAITIAKNYMSIMFGEGEETYYLEQISHEFINSSINSFVLYDSKGYKDSHVMKNPVESVEKAKQ